MNPSQRTSNPDVRHFGLLLLCLLALFILCPLLEGAQISTGVVDAYLSLTLLVTLYSIRDQPIVAKLGGALGLLALLAAIGDHVLQAPSLLLGHVCGVLFFFLTGAALLRRVLQRGPLGRGRLHAAACAYLLLGHGAALVFSVLEHVQPGSFQDPLAGAAPLHAVLVGYPHLVYYSFTTLTTLGFGDVIPLSPLARSLSTLLALVGQLYLALLVGRLVGLYVSEERAAASTAEPAEAQSSASLGS